MSPRAAASATAAAAAAAAAAAVRGVGGPSGAVARRPAWELDPDNAEYGKNAAASVVQGLFKAWLALVQRYRRAHPDVLARVGVSVGPGAARALREVADTA